MSTRATYEIENEVFYIHHDGYEEGAASYFLRMCDEMLVKAYYSVEKRRNYTDSFIAANHRAEKSAHEAHGDTQYRYKVWKSEVSRNPYWMKEHVKEHPWSGYDENNLYDFHKHSYERLWLNAEKAEYNCKKCGADMVRHWVPIYNGPLAVFLQNWVELKGGPKVLITYQRDTEYILSEPRAIELKEYLEEKPENWCNSLQLLKNATDSEGDLFDPNEGENTIPWLMEERFRDPK